MKYRVLYPLLITICRRSTGQMIKFEKLYFLIRNFESRTCFFIPSVQESGENLLRNVRYSVLIPLPCLSIFFFLFGVYDQLWGGGSGNNYRSINLAPTSLGPKYIVQLGQIFLNLQISSWLLKKKKKLTK